MIHAPSSRPAAVLAIAASAGFLVAAEFLPVSLLSPIARDFGISDGRAGQAISISGIFAVLTSLTIVPLTARLDRRHVVASFVAVLALSGLIVGLAKEYPMFLFGRALVGIAVGGFWSFSTATIMRLVPSARVPAALAFLGSSIAFASTFAAPLASISGDLIGWRATLMMVTPVGVVIGLWLWLSLPPLPPLGQTARNNPLALLKRGHVRVAMAATALVFMGQFSIFTYVRPFLEGVTGLSVAALSGMLLAIGLAGVAGTWAVGRVLMYSMFAPLIALPLVLAGIAALILAFGDKPVIATPLFFAWGLVATAAPIGWGLWLARALPDEAEQGGGLQVAVIQTAIAAGAALGGIALENAGWVAVFGVGIACLIGSATLAAVTRVRF